MCPLNQGRTPRETASTSSNISIKATLIVAIPRRHMNGIGKLNPSETLLLVIILGNDNPIWKKFNMVDLRILLAITHCGR